MNKESEVLRISEARWSEAQHWEESLWIRANSQNSMLRVAVKYARALFKPRTLFDYIRFRDVYCGDDWNYWWLRAFEYYRSLPSQVHRALEVGCGPYTNIRLISRVVKINEIHCADPLLESYRKFKWAWLARKLASRQVVGHSVKGEALNLPDGYFDIVVCINVLDHVQDAIACLDELARVVRPGGFVVLGQDLTNEEDVRNHVEEDIGHPILIKGATLGAYLDRSFESVLRKELARQEGRNPTAHYGTLIYVGRRR